MENVNDMKLRELAVENVGGMKFGERENTEKIPKIPTLPTTIDPLATPRLGLGND